MTRNFNALGVYGHRFDSAQYVKVPTAVLGRRRENVRIMDPGQLYRKLLP